METTRKQLMEEIETKLTAIMAEMAAIESRVSEEPHHYTDKTGQTCYECPGAYNKEMTKAMVHDMLWFTPMFQNRCPELVIRMRTLPIRFVDFDIRLMRMFDDEAGNRPLIEWDEKTTCDVIDELRKVVDQAAKLYEKDHDPELKDFMNRCVTWAVRLMYMDSQAYRMQSMESVEKDLFDSCTKCPDEDKKGIVKIFCDIRTRLTKLLVHVPVGTDDHSFVTDKLKLFERLTKTAME